MRGELLFRDKAGARFTLGLAARPEGDTVRLDVTGQGDLGPLAPWLPAALVQAPRAAPLDVRAQLGLSPGDRAAGRASVKLGDAATVEGTLSFQDKQLRVTELRGTADLGIAASTAGVAGPVQGRTELADGEVTWAPERGGWPEARATLRVLETTVPASAFGLDARAAGVEARLEITPGEAGAAVRGDFQGRAGRARRVWSSPPVSSPLRVDIGPGGLVSRAELSGLTAQVLGAPVRGTVSYDVGRARADARLEMATARLDPLVRRLGTGWLGPSDQLHAGSVRVIVDGARPARLERRTGRRGGPRARAAAARRRGRRRARACPGDGPVRRRDPRTRGLERVRGTLPYFEGLLARVEGSADARARRRPERASREAACSARRGRAGDAPGRPRASGAWYQRSCAADGAAPCARASGAALALGAAAGDRIGDGRAPVPRRGVRHLRGTFDA